MFFFELVVDNFLFLPNRFPLTLSLGFFDVDSPKVTISSSLSVLALLSSSISVLEEADDFFDLIDVGCFAAAADNGFDRMVVDFVKDFAPEKQRK
ncbi:hypothetical protein DERP_008433 [Dermatophagoides pteronyssinus]|uniref:Uncharacterized protein n=1 Tax=Dermatophagoides pteronyssinus TaxID=6956 RepID=A0ABQ8IVA6_DERPT|nr:hypothetical protein DERP_008433 [Dermatophagoides pteronyssinus]